MRILASTFPCNIDPSNGAATSIRDMMIGLAERGHACRVLSGPRLDTSGGNDAVLAILGRKRREVRMARCEERTPHTLVELEDRGVETTIVLPVEPVTSDVEQVLGESFLAHHRRLLETFQPDVVVTIMSGWLERRLISETRRHGAAVVSIVCNYGHYDRAFYDGIHALCPSSFLADHYRERIGIRAKAIHPVVDAARVVADTHERKFLTYVSPAPEKGSHFVARILHELSRRRKDIPALVVQGRGSFNWLGKADLDMTSLENLHAMWTTPDAKDFYGVTKVLLMPSVKEPFGMVAVEALANGIPVLGCNRGGLREALAGGGFLLDVPEACTTPDADPPAPGEVGPWLSLIEKLWDDEAFFTREQERAREGAAAFHASSLGPKYEAYFDDLARRRKRRRDPASSSWLLPEDVAVTRLRVPEKREKATVETLRFEKRRVDRPR